MLKLVLSKTALEDIKTCIEQYLNTKCKELNSTIRDNEGKLINIRMTAGPNYDWEKNRVNTPCLIEFEDLEEAAKRAEDEEQDELLKEPKRYEE